MYALDNRNMFGGHCALTKPNHVFSPRSCKVIRLTDSHNNQSQPISSNFYPLSTQPPHLSNAPGISEDSIKTPKALILTYKTLNEHSILS